MGLTLAAMLGHIGLPGGGFGHGYGSMNEPGLPPLRCRLPSLPQGLNPVQTFIPVAAISDMLLHPGEKFDYDGQRLTYPDIKLVYWAAATRSTTTRTFHGCGARSTASTRSSCTTRTGRRWLSMPTSSCRPPPRSSATYSGSRNDPLLMAMPKVTERYAQSRDDYTTFAALAEALGSASSSPKAAPRGSGLRTCTTSGPLDSISQCRRSRSSGGWGGCGCPPRAG